MKPFNAISGSLAGVVISQRQAILSPDMFAIHVRCVVELEAQLQESLHPDTLWGLCEALRPKHLEASACCRGELISKLTYLPI